MLCSHSGRCILPVVVCIALCYDLENTIFDVGVLGSIGVVLELLVVLEIVSVLVAPLEEIHRALDTFELVRPIQVPNHDDVLLYLPAALIVALCLGIVAIETLRRAEVV